jgi:hypothetical protein
MRLVSAGITGLHPGDASSNTGFTSEKINHHWPDGSVHQAAYARISLGYIAPGHDGGISQTS